MSVRVVYTGPFDSIEVPALSVVIERGSVTEVPDDIGKSLCEQDCWVRAGTKAAEAAKEGD